MNVTTTRSMYVACAVAAVLAAANAMAAADNSGAVLEEIVVTARYRAETVQDTPLAITALSVDALSARGIDNTQNLASVVPGLYFAQGTAGAGGSPTISMRGVTQADFNFAFEAPVGIYIDDVYRPTMLGSDLDLLDIDRVEVLRGPQGTLFGKNSMGGALRIFSKQPKGDDTGLLEVAAGNQGQLNYRGSFDTTVIPDLLFMRVSGVSKHIDGYVKLVDFACQMTQNGTPELIPSGVASAAYSNSDCVTGNQGEEDIRAGRVMFRLVPNDRSEVTLALDKSDVSRTVTPDITLGAISEASAMAQGFIPPTGVWDSRFLAPDRYTSYAASNTPNVNDLNEWGIAATGLYRFSDQLRAKVIVAHREYDAASSFNADASPLGIVQNWNVIEHEQDSYELNLSGELFDNALEWTTGAYYFESKEHGGGHIIYTTQSFDQNDNFNGKNQSAFLHLVYNLTDKLSFNAGARYSKDDKEFIYHHPTGAVTDPPPASSVFENNRTDWAVGANYKFTDDLMAYVSVATGYRPGGVNPRPIIVPDQLVPFQSEELTSYEMGLKSQFLDNRLRLNLAAFYSDYKAHLTQATLKQCYGAPGPAVPTLPSVACPVGTLFEVPWFAYFTGPASVRGVEAELRFEPIRSLQIDASTGYNHFKSKVTDSNAPNYVDPANLPQPEWNAAVGIQYGIAFSAGVVTPRLDWTYQSRMTYNGVPSEPYDSRFGLSPEAAKALTSTPSRSLFNARLGFDTDDDKWSAAFSVENLFNEFYWQNKFDLSGLTVSGLPSRPRTWLVTVSRKFL